MVFVEELTNPPESGMYILGAELALQAALRRDAAW